MDSQLRSLVQHALKESFGIEGVSFVIEHPKELSHGDYATNVALIVAKQLAKSPKEVADEIVLTIKKNLPSEIKDVSVAGPGFINFTLSYFPFIGVMQQIFEKKDEWGKVVVHAGKKILVEHSSPNLFKPFHIGHLMNNCIGECITRLARYSGADVSTMSFPSDISLGIAKAIFILSEKYGADFVPDDIAILGDAYVEGTKRYDIDENIHDRVKEIANNLYAGTPSPELELFNKAKKVNIEYFESIVATLGSHFDAYIYESEAGIDGKKIVEEHIPTVFTKSEGAIVYVPGEDRKDINIAVFVNSQGNPTYEAKDIGLIDMKFTRFAPDISIFITDNNQIPHFAVVLAAAENINSEWKDRVQKSTHVPHGRMSFKGQKMSSRLGGVPLVEDILATVKEEVQTKNPDVTADSAKKIGIAALKYSILRAQAGRNIDFDPDTSLSFEGDSGPYLQYTAVRAQSVIEKAKKLGLEPKLAAASVVTDLERLLVRFPGVVEHSIDEWAPHHIVGYLLDIAQAFNSWYGSTQIIDEGNAETPHRLALAAATVQTLKNGLYLLGIEVPEKM